jgi:hypothetical protein
MISTNYHKKIVFGGFNEKLGNEDIFKYTIRCKSIHENRNDNFVRVVGFAKRKF